MGGRYFARLLGARNDDGTTPARDATEAEIEAVAQQFYWFLMRRDIARFDQRDYPTCDTRESQMELYAPPVQSFLEAWSSGALLDDNNVPYNLRNDGGLWRDWRRVCNGGPYYAHQILPWYKEYLDLKGIDQTEASAHILSLQFKKYPKYIRHVTGEKPAKGQRFVPRGHATFAHCASRSDGPRARRRKWPRTRPER